MNPQYSLVPVVVLVGLPVGDGVVQGVGLEPHRRKKDPQHLAIGKKKYVGFCLIIELEYFRGEKTKGADYYVMFNEMEYRLKSK